VRVVWQAAGISFRVYKRQGDGIWAVAGNTEKPEWVDTAVEFGQPYTYLVQTVARAGEREAESEPSAEIPITPKDTFPPAAPAGVRAVTSSVSIEIAWDQNMESDLAGYRIYRAAPGQEFQKVGESTGAPNFSDRNVDHGKSYRYAVAAFDKAGNESARSAVVEAALP
jgi:fibronectin type 3 domain-containing protein